MGFPSAHCIRRPYGAMADGKNTPFRRDSLLFCKKASPGTQQLMALENKFTATFPFNPS
jgi:hypothetical protein